MASIELTISLYTFTTGLIAARIWWQKRKLAQTMGNSEFLFGSACLAELTNCRFRGARNTYYYGWVIAIIIESGAVYCGGLIAELVVWKANNTALVIILAGLSQSVVCCV